MSKSSKKVAAQSTKQSAKQSSKQSSKQPPGSGYRERRAEKQKQAAEPFRLRSDRDPAKWGREFSVSHACPPLDKAQVEEQIASLNRRRNKGICAGAAMVMDRGPGSLETAEWCERQTARTTVAGHFCWVVEDVGGQRREYLELRLFHRKVKPELSGDIGLWPEPAVWRLPCVRERVEPRHRWDPRPSEPFAVAARLFDALFPRKGGPAF